MLLLEESWFSGINAVWSLLVILVMVGLAILVLISRQRVETHVIDQKRADASDKLVETRDRQISDLERENLKINEELEDVTAEYRAVLSIKIDELVKHWEAKQDCEIKWANTESENKQLHRRLGDL